MEVSSVCVCVRARVCVCVCAFVNVMVATYDTVCLGCQHMVTQ